MRALKHVQVSALTTSRFETVLDSEDFDRFRSTFAGFERLDHRVFYNVNSTAQGGGVAEMLHSLLPYVRGAGADARWLVVRGSPEFFALTKRLHNHLHGVEGDGGPLGEAEHAKYRRGLQAAARELRQIVRPEDVVILHDPQTAGLVSPMRACGATVVWRCHVGLDRANPLARQAWEFLRHYVVDADALVFSRPNYEWTGLSHERVEVVRPSIDPFSPKNQPLDDRAVVAILASTGILAEAPESGARFARTDGSPGRVDQATELVQEERLTPSVSYVLHLSRWDRLKDPIGTMRGFVEHVADLAPETHLLLAGPAVARVADDPEGAAVLEETVRAREALPEAARRRVHLATLPMVDPEENAAIVNALQRRAGVVVQKSLVEGFGLTVSEAMWKTRPVVASRIGGIQDQIVDGESGVLVHDPNDLRAFGDAVSGVLGDPGRAERIAAGGRERVRSEFLHPRHLADWARMIERLLATRRGDGRAV